jgi:hypothetical protein
MTARCFREAIVPNEEMTMLRRQRMKLIRFSLIALAATAIAAALVPAVGTGRSQAATHSARSKQQPPTLEQLQAQATAAEKRAAAALDVAGKNKVAAATAAGNLRQAAANFDAMRNLTPGATARPVTPLVPSVQSNYAISAAQTQLQMAQQGQQQAQFSAGMARLRNPTTPGFNGVLINQGQLAVQNAQTSVLAAQQNYTAAQQSANELSLGSSLRANVSLGSLRSAEVNLETARRLSDAANRAAQTAQVNAETLAEDADNARAAVNAAMAEKVN